MVAIKVAADGRVLPAQFPFVDNPEEAIHVESLPEGNVLDYKYIKGEFVYDPLPITEPEPEPTPAQQRENAYNTQPCVEWDDTMLTVTEASQKWQYYAAEGNTTKTDELTALIAEAKTSIREQYPDEEANV